jgi:serine/threonine-protein phosphatase 4 catalytic subunit
MSFDVDKIFETLLQGELPKEQEISSLCSKAKEIMASDENLVRIPSPATICGDIHGQFEDLLELFKVGGEIPDVNYVFLGDYVDRGFKSVETMLYLLALKVKYPERINLIRGNHECRGITQQYGFYDECIRKFGSLNVWRECTNTFDFMIVSAVIDDRIFCVHGGLSPKIKQMKDLNTFDRKKEIPHDGPMCDIMWSDPDESVKTWTYSSRGAGWLFGQEIVEKFCHENKVELIARAHQLVMEGYKQVFNDKLVTVWSAPNYCGKCGNLASILELDENMAKVYKIFEQTPLDEIKTDKKSAGELYKYAV